MIDIKILRENPELIRKGIATKRFDCNLDTIINLDQKRRESLTMAENKRAQQARSSQAIASLPKGSADFQTKIQELKTLSEETKALEKQAEKASEAFKQAFLTLPNIPHPSVPIGKNAQDNVVHSSWGNVESISPYATPHYDIPNFSKAVDFPRGVKVTGAGFPFYMGSTARLVRALLQFFLEEAYNKGYTEVLPPILVNQDSGIATGQLPDKEGMMYTDTPEGLYLIPTAEVPVTNLYRDEIFEEKDLPLKHCAYTPCFRREAGSWGKDVRGLNRLHQFDKVELVKWTHPSQSLMELEGLREDAESLLQKLELPYRVLAICTADMGFPHSKQYDLEVWAGGQKRWLEVSSCSSFTDFQARRANIRYRSQTTGKPEMVHTLNGSALAIPRVLAAIFENNILENGHIRIPSILKKWMGVDTIVF